MALSPLTSTVPPVRSPALSAQIGLARGDITPAPGILARWGASMHDTADTVHRSLQATVLTLRHATKTSRPLVLVDLDLGWWRDRVEPDRLAARLCEAFNLPEENLLISLSHTHSAPVLSRDFQDRPGGAECGPYLDRVADTAMALVREALANECPAVITWARGSCRLAANRDFREPGKDRYVCGFAPGVPADDTLLVGRITGPAGEARGVIVNYACHPTTLGPENRAISPDYVGALRETVEQHAGGYCLFLLGACGELAPAEQYSADLALADRHGRTLGYAVLATLEQIPPAGTELRYAGVQESGAPLGLWIRRRAPIAETLKAKSAVLVLNLQPELPGVSEIDRKLAVPEMLDRFQLERWRRLRAVRGMFGDATTASERIWAWKLGDAWLVATPFEAYSQFQLELRAVVPDPVLVANVVNGWRGYLAPAAHYGRNQYSVWQSPFAAGGLEALTACARTLITSG